MLERLRFAYASIAEIEQVAARVPGDQFVLANLASLKSDAEDLEAQWRELAKLEQKEVCRYRLIPSGSVAFALSYVTRSLLDFQELFSQLYDALVHGPKRRAVVSSSMLSETKFEFGFSYPGSLGVALLVQGERGLLEEKFDSTVDALRRLAEIKSEDDVRKLALAFGDAVVKKTFDWSTVNLIAGYSVDIDWTTARGLSRGGLIDVRIFGQIVDVISRTSDIERDTLRIPGVLIGIDAKAKRFRFVSYEGNGAPYAGPLADAFPLRAVWSINTPYTAQIIVETTTEYATQTTKESYRLEMLEPILPA